MVCAGEVLYIYEGEAQAGTKGGGREGVAEGGQTARAVVKFDKGDRSYQEVCGSQTIGISCSDTQMHQVKVVLLSMLAEAQS